MLNKPYPLYNTFGHVFRFSLGTGLFVALFLIIFQPFGTDSHQLDYKVLFLSGYGILAAFCFATTDLLILRQFKEDHWTVGRQILWLSFQFLLTTVLSYFYLLWGTSTSFQLKNLSLFTLYCFSIGIFPMIGLLLLHYIYQLRHYQHNATQLNKEVHQLEKSTNDKSESFKVFAENEKDFLEFELEDLLFIHADNNYCEFYFKDVSELRKEILRQKLKGGEAQFSAPSIYRCHRSYIANLNAVTEVSGNAQGYRLHFSNSSKTVPVSHSKGKEIKQLILN
jgi:hypothetical protein